MGNMENKITNKEMFSSIRFLFAVLSTTVSQSALSFGMPIIALNFMSFGYTQVQVGMLFAIPTIIFAVTTNIIFLLTDRLH